MPDEYRYRVEVVQRAETADLIYQNHYARGLSKAAQCFGLLDIRAGGALVGVAAFLPPVSQAARCKPLGPERQHMVWDLHRLALLEHDTEPNLTSWFLARALREMWCLTGARVIMSFADATEGHTGTIYRALNALYLGTTPARIAYVGPDGRMHATRNAGHNVTRAEAEARGWTVVRREPKHRYALIIGKGRPSRRELRRDVLRNYGFSLDNRPD